MKNESHFSVHFGCKAQRTLQKKKKQTLLIKVCFKKEVFKKTKYTLSIYAHESLTWSVFLCGGLELAISVRHTKENQYLLFMGIDKYILRYMCKFNQNPNNKM